MASSDFDNPRLGKTDQDGNAVRDRLMDAALQLFARKGFESATVREIVEAAEVTRPTLYYYFGSKEGLYLELVERLCATVEDSVLRSLDPQGTARDRLRSFVLNILDSVIKDTDNKRFFFIIALNPCRTVLSSFHERMRYFIAAVLELLVEEGVEKEEFEVEDAGYIAKVILACVDSFIHNQIFLPDPKSNRDDTAKLLDKLLDQIARQAAAPAVSRGIRTGPNHPGRREDSGTGVPVDPAKRGIRNGKRTKSNRGRRCPKTSPPDHRTGKEEGLKTQDVRR